MNAVTTWFLGTKKAKSEAKYHVLFKDIKGMCRGFIQEDGMSLLGVYRINQLAIAVDFMEVWLNDQYGANWFYNGDKDEYQTFTHHELIGRIKKVYE